MHYLPGAESGVSRNFLYHRETTAPVTESDHGGDGHGDRRRTPESIAPLDEPAAGRATLARRLRAVERAVGGIEGVEFEPGSEGLTPDDLDAMEERLDALCRAVRAIGEWLDARERARRKDDGLEAVRRAVEALPHARDGRATEDARTPGDDTTYVADGSGGGFGSPDRGGEPVDESATEWLDRVAAGGVAPPPTE